MQRKGVIVNGSTFVSEQTSIRSSPIRSSIVVAFFSTAASTTRKAQAPLYHQHRLRRRLQRGRGRRPLYYYCSSLVAPTSKACLELCAVSAAENITMKRSWEL